MVELATSLFLPKTNQTELQIAILTGHAVGFVTSEYPVLLYLDKISTFTNNNYITKQAGRRYGSLATRGKVSTFTPKGT